MNRILNIFIFLSVFTIPFIPIEWNVKIIIAVLFLSFFSDHFQLKVLKKVFSHSWPIIFYLLVLLIGVLYSEEFELGLSVLETNFTFFAIIFIINRYGSISEKTMNQILAFFVYGVLSACLICFIYSIWRVNSTGDFRLFFFYHFTEIIHSHPTYLAYYIIFSITIILNKISIKESGFPRYWIPCLLISFLFGILILTGGRSAFISLLLVCSFFLLKSFLEENIFRRKQITALVLAMILVMLLFTYFDKLKVDNQSLNDTSLERLNLWKAAICATVNPFFGVGTGDYRVVLNKYYIDNGFQVYANSNFNSHNQFLQIYLSNGLLGVAAILFLIGRPIYLAMKNDHALGVLVFFPFLIYGMTEVFLGRYQGVVFFALLHQIFVSYYLHLKPGFNGKRLIR